MNTNLEQMRQRLIEKGQERERILASMSEEEIKEMNARKEAEWEACREAHREEEREFQARILMKRVSENEFYCQEAEQTLREGKAYCLSFTVDTGISYDKLYVTYRYDENQCTLEDYIKAVKEWIMKLIIVDKVKIKYGLAV